MCGIGLLLILPHHQNNRQNEKEWNEQLSQTLSSRGPDLPRQMCYYDNVGSSLTLHGSVLHMRGFMPSAQPMLFSLGACPDDGSGEQSSGDENTGFSAESKCALCWNGECYTYDSMDLDAGHLIELPDKSETGFVTYRTMVELVTDTNKGLSFDSHDVNHNHLTNTPNSEQSDTIVVKNLLSKSFQNTRRYAKRNNTTNDQVASLEHEAIARTLARIHGEFAFLLHVPSQLEDQRQGRVYFGRDVLGRRSLLINKSIGGLIIISSVASQSMGVKNGNGGVDVESTTFDNSWEELPPGIVYRMDVTTGEVTSIPIPRTINNEIQYVLPSTVPPDDATKSKTIFNPQTSHSDSSIENAAKHLLQLLDKSIQRRVMNAPLPKSQCNSDASVAVLFSGGIDSVIIAALSHRHVPPNRSIDLINVSFYDESDSSSSAVSPDRLAALHSYLEMSTKWPDRNWRFIAVDVSYREVLEVESKVLRLISPLDSTMDFNIAVAFWFAGRGKGRVVSQAEARYLVTDIESRSTSTKTSSQEPLLRYSQSNGTLRDNESCRASVQSGPSQTSSMKHLSCIREGCTRPAVNGCVFSTCKFCCGKLHSPISKFLGYRAQICQAHQGKKNKQASTASAQVQASDTCVPTNATITSAAKILLSGVGADEQMAGYGRHRTTFQRGGYKELREELKMEVDRLWTRNLGRDDRCLSDCGKEARFPYLDEDVVAYLEALPLPLKCNLNLPQGEGDKLILRKVARMIGVCECSALVKRAIQFGSRIAKVSDKNRFGSQRRATGQAKHVRG